MIMDHYCLMGHPVAHSKSPWIHARFAALTHQDLDYQARLVPLTGFTEEVRRFAAEGGRGCNITVPFKFEAAALASQVLTPRALRAAAANTLRFEDGRVALADNTDGTGLVTDIERNAGMPLEGRRVLLVGAGGAAAGVLGPLLEACPAELQVVNRSPAKALDLLQGHGAIARSARVRLTAGGLQEAGSGFDVVINATASSLGGAQVPVPASVLAPGALAYDMMYGPAAAAFLHWAQRHGAQPRDGLGMLVEQAAESFAVWRGVRPPSAQVLQELRELLTERAP
jgi:shikimate dehydrogenase